MSMHMAEKPLKTGIEKKFLKKGEDFTSLCADETAIIFLFQGELGLQVSGNEIKIEAGKMFFFPAGAFYDIHIREDSSIIWFPFDPQVSSVEGIELFSLLSSESKEDLMSTSFSCCLPFRKSLRHFLFLLEVYLDNKIDPNEIYKIKIRELVVLLLAYYTPQELSGFFAPILNNDMNFRELVFKNYLKFNTVEALAQHTCYSTSGFTKKFQRVFHESPYQWILRNKAQKILSDIKLSEKTFKEITMEYGFSSQSHFYLFCKKQYDASPSLLRKGS